MHFIYVLGYKRNALVWGGAELIQLSFDYCKYTISCQIYLVVGIVCFCYMNHLCINKTYCMKNEIIELINLLLPKYGYFVPTDNYMYFGWRRATLVKELLKIVKGEDSTLFDKISKGQQSAGSFAIQECKTACDAIVEQIKYTVLEEPTLASLHEYADSIIDTVHNTQAATVMLFEKMDNINTSPV